jgi:hypothetical protein
MKLFNTIFFIEEMRDVDIMIGYLVTVDDFVRAHPAWAAKVLHDVAFVQQKDDLDEFVRTVKEIELAPGFTLYLGMERIHAVSLLAKSGERHTMTLGAYVTLPTSAMFDGEEFSGKLMSAMGEPGYFFGRRPRLGNHGWEDIRSCQESDIERFATLLDERNDPYDPLRGGTYAQGQRTIKIWAKYARTNVDDDLYDIPL